MSTEIAYLVYVSTFTALLWVPYILDRFLVWGLLPTLGYPENPPPQSGWAQRAKKAHYNAVENLVVFAALVLAVEIAGRAGPATAMACTLYFWARVVHYGAYTLGVSYLRTVAFLAGWAAQIALALQLLG